PAARQIGAAIVRMSFSISLSRVPFGSACALPARHVIAASRIRTEANDPRLTIFLAPGIRAAPTFLKRELGRRGGDSRAFRKTPPGCRRSSSKPLYPAVPAKAGTPTKRQARRRIIYDR